LKKYVKSAPIEGANNAKANGESNSTSKTFQFPKNLN